MFFVFCRARSSTEQVMIQSGPCNNFLPDIAGPLPVSADVSIITLIHGSPVRPPGFHLVSCHPLQSFLYLDSVNFAQRSCRTVGVCSESFLHEVKTAAGQTARPAQSSVSTLAGPDLFPRLCLGSPVIKIRSNIEQLISEPDLCTANKSPKTRDPHT